MIHIFTCTCIHIYICSPFCQDLGMDERKVRRNAYMRFSRSINSTLAQVYIYIYHIRPS